MSSSIKSKSLIIPLMILVIVTSVLVYSLVSSSGDKNSSNKTNSGSEESALTKYSPADIIKNLNDFLDKEIILFGTLNQIGADTYIVDEKPNGGAVKVSFNKSGIDPSAYVNVVNTDPTKSNDKVVPKGKVNATGKLVIVNDKKNTAYVFEISKIDK